MQSMLKLNLDRAKLMELGAILGSDVPFMFEGGTALAQGRGEIITPISPIKPAWVVLVKPNFGISTAKAYQKIGQAAVTHPDVMGMKKAIEKGASLAEWATLAGNVIQQAVSDDYPMIKTIERALIAQGAMLAMLSGSGSTVFGLFDDYVVAVKASKQVANEINSWCQVVATSHKGIEIINSKEASK
jgi:4-diphosphocytidyl-2-C-methyl-D-erythritol kinase